MGRCINRNVSGDTVRYAKYKDAITTLMDNEHKDDQSKEISEAISIISESNDYNYRQIRGALRDLGISPFAAAENPHLKSCVGDYLPKISFDSYKKAFFEKIEQNKDGDILNHPLLKRYSFMRRGKMKSFTEDFRSYILLQILENGAYWDGTGHFDSGFINRRNLVINDFFTDFIDPVVASPKIKNKMRRVNNELAKGRTEEEIMHDLNIRKISTFKKYKYGSFNTNSLSIETIFGSNSKEKSEKRENGLPINVLKNYYAQFENFKTENKMIKDLFTIIETLPLNEKTTLLNYLHSRNKTPGERVYLILQKIKKTISTEFGYEIPSDDKTEQKIFISPESNRMNLSNKIKNQLEKYSNSTEEIESKRAKMILLFSTGMSILSIARTLNVKERSVDYMIKTFRKTGMEAIKKKKLGRPTKIL